MALNNVSTGGGVYYYAHPRNRVKWGDFASGSELNTICTLADFIIFHRSVCNLLDIGWCCYSPVHTKERATRQKRLRKHSMNMNCKLSDKFSMIFRTLTPTLRLAVGGLKMCTIFYGSSMSMTWRLLLRLLCATASSAWWSVYIDGISEDCNVISHMKWCVFGRKMAHNTTKHYFVRISMRQKNQKDPLQDIFPLRSKNWTKRRRKIENNIKCKSFPLIDKLPFLLLLIPSAEIIQNHCSLLHSSISFLSS